MGKDKSLQKIVQPKSLEKIIEYNVLVKRGLRALGIETPEDKFEKELYKLINEFSNLIFFKKLRNEQFIKFGKADARTYLNKLNKLADKIIAVCQKTLKNIGSNSPLKFPTSFMMGFLLMSKNRNQDATVFFSECLKQHDQMFYLLLWSGKTELVESPEPEEKRLLDIILREKKIIPTSKEFRKLSNRLWNKFGKRDYACISTLAGDCYLKLKDRGNALVYYQKTINFLAAIYQESQPRMRIWRESRGYLQEMYDEIIDFLYEWKGLQAVDEFIHRNENKYAPSEEHWLSCFFQNSFFPDEGVDCDRLDNLFSDFDISQINNDLQIKKYSKKELIGYAIGNMYYDLGGLDKDSILESSKFSLEIIQSLRNIFPRDNEIDFVYNKMLHKYENEITKLKQND